MDSEEPPPVKSRECRATSEAGRAQLEPLCTASPLTRVLCRSTARTALTGLRARRWVDGSTRAVSVHFLLYNPPTRLFSSVSLRSEMLPARGLALSSLVQSVTVFHGDSAPRCHLLLPQVSSPATRPLGHSWSTGLHRASASTRQASGLLLTRPPP